MKFLWQIARGNFMSKRFFYGKSIYKASAQGHLANFCEGVDLTEAN